MEDKDRIREAGSNTRKQGFYKWGATFTTIVIITTIIIVALGLFVVFGT